jgi:molybdenum-dependent DNA-binding transcriptional regulator ModE
MSYRLAWVLVHQINDALQQPSSHYISGRKPWQQRRGGDLS